ncbi:Transcription initiation factor TFIID subunit 3 [Holothuria leucospilota]|uniref:Transcription initiation factor TFIID subunit 3 n=1 Tax=Holothuria leucospilota TaxID=206669 RepID=A0A9Q1H5F5_HOLLE|nr:Transcription initiation factor TFIID subunit 3 [Holothuria leucospilota]
MGGAVLKGLQYTFLMAKHKRVGVSVAVGTFNTGKSLSAKLALSICGLHEGGMIASISDARLKRLSGAFAMPVCLNDVRLPKIIEEAVMGAFEPGYLTNCRGNLQYLTSPIVTCNRDVLTAVEKKMSPRELSRISLLTFDVPLPAVSDDERTELDKAMTHASSSVGRLIGARDELMEVETLKQIRGLLKSAIPFNQWHERLVHVYSLDMWCSHVFSTIVGHEVSIRELVQNFKSTTLKDVVRYQLFHDPYGQVLETIETLLQHAVKMLPLAKLKQMVSIGKHVFDGRVRTTALCIKLSDFLNEVCPLDKSRIQSCLRKGLGGHYATGKHRFSGEVHQCTMIWYKSVSDNCYREVAEDGSDDRESMDDSGYIDDDCVTTGTNEVCTSPVLDKNSTSSSEDSCVTTVTKGAGPSPVLDKNSTSSSDDSCVTTGTKGAGPSPVLDKNSTSSSDDSCVTIGTKYACPSPVLDKNSTSSSDDSCVTIGTKDACPSPVLDKNGTSSSGTGMQPSSFYPHQETTCVEEALRCTKTYIAAKRKRTGSGLLTAQASPPKKRKTFICPCCLKECLEDPKTFSQQSIGCDDCQRWWHWLCAGITRKAPSTHNWTCPDCKKQ